MEVAWHERGLASPRLPSILVLFDVSPSAESCRGNLLKQLQEELTALPRQPSSASAALIFDESIRREGTLAELSSGVLVAEFHGNGTDLIGAIRIALERLQGLPQPRQLWIFTDGEEIGDVLSLETEIRSAITSVVVIESRQQKERSDLQRLSALIGGRHVYV
jgi:hypothetical protein